VPSYRVRMHMWDGKWVTIYTGADSLADAAEMAIAAIKAEDPEAMILDEVVIKRMTPRNADGSWGQADRCATPE